MLLSHARSWHLPIDNARRQSRHLLALSMDGKSSADRIMTRALNADVTEFRPAQDHGFLYGRACADPDGHT